MSITSKLRRQGGATIITIPSSLLKQMDVEVGGELELAVHNGKLTARPVGRHRLKRYSLAELLQGSDAIAELNDETAWAREGDPVGRERS